MFNAYFGLILFFYLQLKRFGFNILLHGVGSKKSLMQKFCHTHLANDYYVELLGYHHDFNTKNLLRNIISDILELNETFKTSDEQLNAINNNLSN
jgi:origin recognition complex subunit 2